MAVPFKNGLVFKRSSSRLIAQNIRKELAVPYKHQFYHETNKNVDQFLSFRPRKVKKVLYILRFPGEDVQEGFVRLLQF